MKTLVHGKSSTHKGAILCTGHAGFIGSRLFQRLVDMEENVYGIDKKINGNLLACEFRQEVQLIYHLAAHKSVEESHTFPLIYEENLTTTVRLAKIFPHARIIHASSAAAMEPVLSPYGFFKKAASEYLSSFHEDYVNLVLPNIYGGQQAQNSVVDIFKDGEVVIQGDGSAVRDYVHVDDIVAGFLKAMNWPKGNYFMGSDKGTSTLQLAEATGKDFTFAPPRSGGKEAQESIVLNTTPTWKPTINVIDYLHG